MFDWIKIEEVVLNVKYEVLNKITQNIRKKFIKGNVLNFCDDDPASFLENGCVVPSRIEGAQFLSNTVVFAHPNGVHHR